MPKTLGLFEGDGASVRTNLYKPFEHMFEKTMFLLASNEQQGEGFVSKSIQKAIKTRVRTVSMEEEFNGEGTFPYTADQLAKALQFLSNERAKKLALEAASYFGEDEQQ